MERILFGDNQFFAVNHLSDEKARSLSLKFKEDKAILKTLNYAMDAGVNTFMCTTHDRISAICQNIREDPAQYSKFRIYPCMPYAHKYANALTELGVSGVIKEYVPGNFFGSMFKGGYALLSKDCQMIMELMIDAEMKMFYGIHTPVIFLQNVITDLLLGLGMHEFLFSFKKYVERKYNAEAGFITMNMPLLLSVLERAGIQHPIVCTSINKVGFRMSGGRESYEHLLQTTSARVIAMQVLAAGAIPPPEALDYICGLPNIESILFGASSRQNINETVTLIKKYDELYKMPISI